jgi:hypothetical protein
LSRPRSCSRLDIGNNPREPLLLVGRKIFAFAFRKDENGIDRKTLAEIKRNHPRASAFAASRQPNAALAQSAGFGDQLAAFGIERNAGDDSSRSVFGQHGVDVLRERVGLGNSLQPPTFSHGIM